MAKLTKEEKKARKEAKRLEKLAAAEELRRKLKRDELDREMAAQSIRRKELERGWRGTMLSVKLPGFKRQVEVMWHTFERAYDKKDCLIMHIVKLMEAADSQYGRTVASFCETIDNMTNKFHADLEEMSHNNDVRTANLLNSGEEEAANITREHNAAETHIQLLLFHAHWEADDLAWRTRGENLVKADDERERCLNERDDLRSFIENVYSLMWDDYKSVLRGYVSSTSENQKKVRRLRRKENLMADIIAAQAKHMIRSQVNIKVLRNELQQYESGSKQAIFRERRDRHRNAYRNIKRAMVDGLATDEAQLDRVVTATNNAIEWLELANKKGEKMLRMAAICRKFETQKEKVLPFGTRQPHSPIHCDKNKRGKPIGDPLVCEEIVASSDLSRLYQRMSRVNVSLAALAREKMYLTNQNRIIKERMAEYIEMQKNKTKQCYCEDPPPGKPVAVDGTLAYKIMLH